MTESIIRIEQRRDFTVLQNEMLRDRRLCLKTKGLFAVMLSRPGNWQFSVSGLSAYMRPITPCRQDHTIVSCQSLNSISAFSSCFSS